jgi:hypothetical protein
MIRFVYITIIVFIIIAVLFSFFKFLPILPKDTVFIKEGITIHFPILTTFLISVAIVVFLKIIGKI